MKKRLKDVQHSRNDQVCQKGNYFEKEGWFVSIVFDSVEEKARSGWYNMYMYMYMFNILPSLDT